jgi:hypothetical protein
VRGAWLDEIGGSAVNTLIACDDVPEGLVAARRLELYAAAANPAYPLVLVQGLLDEYALHATAWWRLCTDGTGMLFVLDAHGLLTRDLLEYLSDLYDPTEDESNPQPPWIKLTLSALGRRRYYGESAGADDIRALQRDLDRMTAVGTTAATRAYLADCVRTIFPDPPEHSQPETPI